MTVLSPRRPGESLADYAARRRAERAQAKAPAGYDPDLVPEPGQAPSSAEDDAITALLEGDSIVDAYRRWCGKMEPSVNGKRESVMVSCPNPLHPDAHPSAWVNLDKDVGTCPLCGGFDQYDIFAWNNGQFSKDTYKTDGTFPAMRRAMAEDLGYVVRRTAGGTEYVEQVVTESPQTNAAPSPSPTAPENDGTAVLPFPAAVPDSLPEGGSVPIDWRNLLDPSSTFLYRWMEACSIDDLPEEFYFWLGLMALGCAVGNNVKLKDRYPVRANLLLCLTGPTGMGKSRATSALARLIREAFPYHIGQAGGVKMIAEPASAEILIDSFNEPIYDPADPKVVIGYQPVRGLVQFNELSALIGKASRQGNVLKPKIMEFYDADAPVSTSSRGHGVAEAKDHFSQVVSSTQPRAMRDMLSRADDDSGFLNRWVFATGIAKTPVAIGGDIIDVQPLVDLIRDVRAWGSTPRTITLDDQATELWTRFFHEQIVPLKKNEDASVYVRLDLLMKKLMLLLAIDKHEDVVDVRTVEQVISLWEYLTAGYADASEAVNSSLESDLDAAIERVAKAVKTATGKGATVRDFQRGMPGLWRRVGSQAVMKQLKALGELGLLKEVAIATSGKGGRPTSRWEIAEG